MDLPPAEPGATDVLPNPAEPDATESSPAQPSRPGPHSLAGVHAGYWVWEQLVMGMEVQPPAFLDAGEMKIAFGSGNDKCHDIWNETTGSDFHTECTFAVDGDMVTYTGPIRMARYSCAHPVWTS